MCNVFYMRSKIYIFEKLGLLKTQKPAGEKKNKDHWSAASQDYS